MTVTNKESNPGDIYVRVIDEVNNYIKYICYIKWQYEAEKNLVWCRRILYIGKINENMRKLLLLLSKIKVWLES